MNSLLNVTFTGTLRYQFQLIYFNLFYFSYKKFTHTHTNKSDNTLDNQQNKNKNESRREKKDETDIGTVGNIQF